MQPNAGAQGAVELVSMEERCYATPEGIAEVSKDSLAAETLSDRQAWECSDILQSIQQTKTKTTKSAFVD